MSSEPAISLARYAQRIGYQDCAFWGVLYSGDATYECRRVWTGADRQMIEDYLRQAQEQIEAEIGYFLAPSWVEAERHTYRDPLVLEHGYVIGGGVRSDVKIGDSVSIDHTADPAAVTATIGTIDVKDVRIYHEDTDIEITPSGYTEDGAGNVIFTIPLCRLVDPAYADNDENGLDYGDAATWRAARVDVRAIMNDTSEQAELIWRHQCTTTCLQRKCEDYRKTACVYVRNTRAGIVDVTRADYSAGTWTAVTTCETCYRGRPQWVEISYYSGLTTLTRQAEDAIIRLAHVLMPHEPCACGPGEWMWTRDRKVPEILTPQQAACPWGTQAGAYFAWRQAQTMRLGRASVI